jgi:phage tail-like protein
MARAIATDPFQVFSFSVMFPQEVDPSASFSKSTIPAFKVAVAEYKTLLQKYPRKYPGSATVDDVVMSRGVMLKNTNFYDWVRATQKVNILGPAGLKEYRKDIVLIQNHRTGFYRKYNLYDCLPINFKSSSDLDAMSNDIAIEELTLAVEDFDIEEGGEAIVLVADGTFVKPAINRPPKSPWPTVL